MGLLRPEFSTCLLSRQSIVLRVSFDLLPIDVTRINLNHILVDNITMTAALSDPVVTNLDSRPGSAISTNKRKSMTPIAGDQKVKRPRGWNLRGGKAHALTRAQAEAEGETGDFETEPTTEGDKGGNGRLTKKPKKRTSGTSKAQAEVCFSKARNVTTRLLLGIPIQRATTGDVR